ncbi:MAG: thermonuclease family protein [Patescibacteria group bacterium]
MDEYFAREATNYLTQEVLNKNILLEPDKISDDKDRYGRLLRYVYIDGKDINANLIKDGYARIYLVFPFDKQEEYKQLSDVAEKNQLGLHNFDMRTIFLSDKNFTVEYFVGLFLFLFIFVLLVYLFKKNKVK